MTRKTKSFDPRALRSIRVGPYDYAVHWLDAPRDMMGCVGQVKHETQVIDVLCHGSPQWMADTLLHEVLHAVVATQNLNGHPPFDEDKVEERMVATLATGLVQVIRDNPELVVMLARLVNGIRPDDR